jgi:hypothetical protein
MVGCAPDPDPVPSFEAWTSDAVPTVVILRWEPDRPPLDVLVGVSDEDDSGRQFEMVEGEDGVFGATLLGLKPSRSYDIRLDVLDDQGWVTSETQTAVTGPVPSAFPSITVEGELEGFVATSVIQAPSIAVVIDGDGDYVWWHQVGEGDVPWNHAVITRFGLARDGARVCYLAWTPLFPGSDYMADRDLVCMDLDGGDAALTGVPGAHHDFAELPDGTFAVMSHDPQTVDGDDVIGDRLLEIGEGTERALWSLWDHHLVDPEDLIGHDQDYSHGNALQYDDVEDVCYLSMRYFDFIVKIDRGTGEELWHLGGEESDFAFVGDEGMRNQHQFQVLDGGILVFDNGEDGATASRVVEYALDEVAGTAHKVWEYASDPPMDVYSLGDVHRLSGGETLITWSTAGLAEVVEQDGEVSWSAALELGSAFGYSRFYESLPGER